MSNRSGTYLPLFTTNTIKMVSEDGSKNFYVSVSNTGEIQTSVMNPDTSAIPDTIGNGWITTVPTTVGVTYASSQVAFDGTIGTSSSVTTSPSSTISAISRTGTNNNVLQFTWNTTTAGTTPRLLFDIYNSGNTSNKTRILSLSLSIPTFDPLADGSLATILFLDFGDDSKYQLSGNDVIQFTESKNGHILAPYQNPFQHTNGSGYAQLPSVTSGLREADGYNVSKPFYAQKNNLTYYIVIEPPSTVAGQFAQTVCAGASSTSFESQIVNNGTKVVGNSPRIGIGSGTITALTPTFTDASLVNTGKHIYRFTYKVTGTFGAQTTLLQFWQDGVQTVNSTYDPKAVLFGNNNGIDYRPKAFASTNNNLTLFSRGGTEPLKDCKVYEIGMFDEADKFLAGGQYENFEIALKIKYGIS